MNTTDDDELGPFFEAARTRKTDAPEHLLRAVLADGEAMQPAPRGLPKAAAEPKGWFPDVWRGFGGWRGAVALGLFLAVGIATGYQPPTALEAVTTALVGGADDVDNALVFSLDGLMSEG